MNSEYVRVMGFEVYGEVQNIPLEEAKALQFVYKDGDGEVQYRVPQRRADDIDWIGEQKLEKLGNVDRPSYIDTRGVYVSNSHHVKILDNTIHHMPGGGLRVSYSEHVDIIGNTIHDCSRRSYSGTHALVVTYADDKLPPEGSGNYRVRVLRNRLHHNYNEMFSWAPTKDFIEPHIDEGKGISLQRNQNFKNGGRILVANNLAWWNGFSGVHSNDGDNIELVHNTAYMNAYTALVTNKDKPGRGNNIGISISGGKNCRIFNNIAVIPTGWGAKPISVANAVNLQVGSNVLYGIGDRDLQQDGDVVPLQGAVYIGDPLFTEVRTELLNNPECLQGARSSKNIPGGPAGLLKAKLPNYIVEHPTWLRHNILWGTQFNYKFFFGTQLGPCLQVDDEQGSYAFSITSEKSPAVANAADALWTPCEDALGYLRSANGATIGAYEHGSDLLARHTMDGDAVGLDECYNIPDATGHRSREAPGTAAVHMLLHIILRCLHRIVFEI